MAREVFTNTKVGKFYNKNFINIKINAEKGEGINFVKKHLVSGYPTIIYFENNGDVKKKITSYANIEQILSYGELALTSNKEFQLLKGKYEKDEISISELFKYLLAVKSIRDGAATAEVFDKYFVRSANKNITEDLLNTIPEYATSSKCKAFQYLINNESEFKKKIISDKVDQTIRSIYITEFRRKNIKDDNDYFQTKKVLKAKVIISELEDLKFDSNHYWMTQNEDAYIKTASVLYEKFYKNNDHEISNLLGSVRFVQKKENLETLLVWAKRAIELKENSLNFISLAMVYKGLKNKEKAIEYFDKAAEVSKKDKDGYHEQIEMLKQTYLNPNK